MECSTHQIPKPVTVIIEAGIHSIPKSLVVVVVVVVFDSTSSSPSSSIPHRAICVPLHNQAPSYLIRSGPISCPKLLLSAVRPVHCICRLGSGSCAGSRMISSAPSPPRGHIPHGFPSAYRGPGPVPQHSHSLQRACLPALLLWSPGLCPARA